jgi:hypothetical protein
MSYIHFYFQTLHKDDNDQVIDDITILLDASCEHYLTSGTQMSDSERNIFDYLQRARALYDDKVSMSTICCWKALETCHSNTCNETGGSYIHFFCCESLGFALDISSTCLMNSDLSGSYGGSFSSFTINHGTSVPLSINMSNDDVLVSVKPQSLAYIPFAWGRSGGPA